MDQFEAPASLCELATRFAIEDEAEAARVRQAQKIDRLAKRLGVTPATLVRMSRAAGTGAALAARRAA